MSLHPNGPSRPLALVATAAVLGTAACGSAGSGAVTASDPAVGANPGDSVALYVDLDNDGSSDELVSASCDCAAQTSLHLTEDRGGVMLMMETEAIALPAGERTTLLPGGPHVMLEGLDAPLTAGSTIEVTLGFEHSDDIVLEVPVVALEDLAERVGTAEPVGGGGG